MKEIKYLILDVDGTLTDGKIYMSECGELCKAFNAKDGYGIRNILCLCGIIPIVITGRISNILENRCKELKIYEIHQGVLDKIQKLDEVLMRLNGKYSNCAYIGDDINDLACMNVIKSAGGIVGCPVDAADQVKIIADFISRYKGGEGAVREFIEYITSF